MTKLTTYERDYERPVNFTAVVANDNEGIPTASGIIVYLLNFNG